MDCILFCIFSTCSSPKQLGCILTTESSASPAVWAPWLLRLLPGSSVQGCLLETSHRLHQRQNGVWFQGSPTPGITSSDTAVVRMHPCWYFPFPQPYNSIQVTLVISNAPHMPDATPRACNIFLTSCYKMVTWVGCNNSVKLKVSTGSGIGSWNRAGIRRKT